MNHFSLDILRQSGWDIWLVVCAAASLVLLGYIATARLWRTVRGWLTLPLALLPVCGTVLIIAVPSLHRAGLGMIWTFVVLSVLSLFFYLNLLGQLGTGRTIMLLTMRLTALALIVLMLFGPQLRYLHRPEPERPLLFLIDTSGSMSFPDVQNGPTRLQSVWQVLRPQLPRIREHFVPSFFTFDTEFKELKKPEELATLQADGKATDIAMGLSKTMAHVARPDAAVVLFSDGIDNTSPDVLEAVRSAPAPIHTVLVGSEQAEPSTMANVAVDDVETADDFVVGHESQVKAKISSTALANRVVDVKLAEVDAAGKPIGDVVSRQLVLQPLPQGQFIDLPYKPAKVGVHRLAVWIDPIPGERSTADNRQEFQGLALDPRIKVLYIEGRARPEYRDLNRAMERDSNIEVASLLRIQTDRFAAAGTVDGEPFKRMPQTLDEWKKFDVIILGDLDSSFLSPAQQHQIEQFTSGGGGLLMIGGQNNFGPGGYKDTPVEKALPVFCGDTSSAQEKSQFVPRITAEGMIHPIMEGLTDWFAPAQSASSRPTSREADRILPPLRGNVVVSKPKSGAEVLLIHPDRLGPDGKPQIVLAVQRYGQGRSAAFTVDTTYLWYLPLRGLGQDSPYNKLWGQLVRWLAGTDVRNRQQGAGIEGLLNKSVYQLGESVRIRVMVRDERGDATRYANVTLRLQKAGDPKPHQYPLSPSEARTGMYDLTLPTPDKGDYTLELSATKDGKPLGKQDLKFSVIAPADEMLKLAANPTLMEDLALKPKAGGTFRRLDQFPSLIDELLRSDRTTAVAQERTVPLDDVLRAALSGTSYDPKWPRQYDLPIQAILVLVLLGGEWFLRRHWQLP